ncbi:type VII secretion protein [Bacillus wiedmannii]|uniref:Type VII secretion protein n=1 Tax=Bacillus wiedmannii TaxID=1890302 RepID=A0A2B5K0W9_9BACI|nr:type VII secretion protein [Bacillus wiedmannii]PFZ43024.1 type VII secretion protein [Bacillus wiedmannii]PGA89173.1 type VII secretion protein [Bacillus wiedmannii]PGD61582.1 type VII secretion protein [Bacillus wiedmannii]PHF61130.1 type VII secretion protein [Bacillus wiedmannii]
MGEGLEIKVKPEQLEQIAKNISEMQTHSQNIQQNLNQSMFSIQMQWQGATSQHFYGEYMRSMRLMESYIRNLQVTEKELRRIAQKFRQADEEYQKKQNEKLKETHKKEKKNEKSWWEKGVEGAAEFIGVNDAIRAVTGKDPITGKELSSKERLIAAGWTLLNFVPVGKVASLAGKGIKYVASSFGKTIVKAGKRLGEGVTMVAGKAGKAAVDGIKTASYKVKEGVNFVASTAKGFADKIGSLWNKGATTVKTTFLQGNEKIQHAVKTLLEYKWIPGEGKGFAMAGVGKVSGGGQYSLKEAYQYMESKVVKGTGEATTKKKSVPDWLKERWEAGNNFNKENRPRYPYNEVELEAKEVGGKKYVVDSYAHNKEIVSRKFTQISEVQEKTAKSYLNEITKKYPSGSKISNGPFNPNALKGGRLKGELILEVPVQNKPIPQTILDEATKNRIIIRDIKGKVYN